MELAANRCGTACLHEIEELGGVHILLVEDDAPLGSALHQALERLGYTVTWLRDGQLALSLVKRRQADFVVLDLGLPRCDGIEIVRQARRAHIDTPMLIITARDAISSRVEVLDAGADDYLIKPFEMGELAARIRALTRRRRGFSINRIEVGAVTLDLETTNVTFRGNPVDLTRREFALLLALIENDGRILQRHELENSVYGIDNIVGTNTLDVLLHSLRRKLSWSTIRNVRGFGYVISRDPE